MSVEARYNQTSDYEPVLLRTEQLIDHFPVMEEVLEGLEDNVYLVRADDNPAGTFKERGAKDRIEQLYGAGIRHIAVSSAGNHLRGSIQGAAPLGMKLTGVLPVTAPEEKRHGSEKLWLECGGRSEDLALLAVGNTYDDADRFLQETMPEIPRVHAFDDPLVIDGRKTLAFDIARTLPGVTHTVSATGGGSLLAALTAGFSDLGMPTETLGVEARGSDSLSLTLQQGSELPVPATNPNRRYGGLCVERVGSHAVKLLVNHGFTSNRLFQADDADVRKLIESYDVHDQDFIEPSSIVAVAGLIACINAGRFTSTDTVAVIASGHNEHPRRLLDFPASRKMHIASAHVLR